MTDLSNQMKVESLVLTLFTRHSEGDLIHVADFDDLLIERGFISERGNPNERNTEEWRGRVGQRNQVLREIEQVAVEAGIDFHLVRHQQTGGRLDLGLIKVLHGNLFVLHKSKRLVQLPIKGLDYICKAARKLQRDHGDEADPVLVRELQRIEDMAEFEAMKQDAVSQRMLLELQKIEGRMEANKQASLVDMTP